MTMFTFIFTFTLILLLFGNYYQQACVEAVGRISAGDAVEEKDLLLVCQLPDPDSTSDQIYFTLRRFLLEMWTDPAISILTLEESKVSLKELFEQAEKEDSAKVRRRHWFGDQLRHNIYLYPVVTYVVVLFHNHPMSCNLVSYPDSHMHLPKRCLAFFDRFLVVVFVWTLNDVVAWLSCAHICSFIQDSCTTNLTMAVHTIIALQDLMHAIAWSNYWYPNHQTNCSVTWSCFLSDAGILELEHPPQSLRKQWTGCTS